MTSRAKRRSRAVKQASPRPRDAEATRLALIRAGEKVFSERGFAGATLDVLAEEAGANKALVSYYFGSKEGLYDAVVNAAVSEVLETVQARMQKTGDPVRTFRSYIRALALAFSARPSFPAVLMREFIEGSMLGREAPFRDVVQFYRMTERLYEAGRKEKLFRKVDPHMLHLSIVGPLVHFVLTARAREGAAGVNANNLSSPDIAAFSAHIERTIIAGLRRAG